MIRSARSDELLCFNVDYQISLRHYDLCTGAIGREKSHNILKSRTMELGLEMVDKEETIGWTHCLVIQLFIFYSRLS